jgi:hypothetical protein
MSARILPDMKPKRRILFLTVVLPISLAGLVAAILMAPGSIEGVYNPFSTAGCTGDQFIEMRDGKVVQYVTCSPEAYLESYYENEPSGTVAFRFSSEINGKPTIRAEPYLLGTRFQYLSDGKSEWKWKRFFTRKMKAHVAAAKIRDIAFESGGTRITTYDSKFNVIDSTLRPMKVSTPAVAPGP